MPLISIIVPIYNVENYLRECLDSILNQTLEDIEVICVNDGSTDRSLEILQEYSNKDLRIKIINKTNSGYGHTMNVGIDMASGEYMGIVEPDDYVRKDMYEELYKIAVSNKVDIVKADFYRFVNDGDNIVKTYNHLSTKKEYYNRIINPNKELEAFKFIMNTWSGIYNLEFIRKNKIRHNETPGASYQDNGFWFEGFCLSERIYLVDKPFYMNRRDNPNSSVHNKEKVYCTNIEYEYIRKFLVDRNLYEKFKYVFVMKLWHNCWFTYNRIGREFKIEYLKETGRIFRECLLNKEINKCYFSEKEILAIKWIVNFPNSFFVFYEIYMFLKKLHM